MPVSSLWGREHLPQPRRQDQLPDGGVALSLCFSRPAGWHAYEQTLEDAKLNWLKFLTLKRQHYYSFFKN